MTERDTLSIISKELGQAFLPLSRAVSSPAAFKGFMARLGWTVEDIPQPIQSLTNSLRDLQNALDAVVDGDPTPEMIEPLRKAIADLTNAIKGLENATFDTVLAAENFASLFPQQVVQFLIINYLTRYRPKLAFILRVLGLIRVNYAKPSDNRPGFMHYEFAWADILKLLKDPFSIFEIAYKWKTVDFDSQAVLQHIQDFMVALRVPAFLEEMDDELARYLENKVDLPGNPKRWKLNISFLESQDENGDISAGLGLFALPQNDELLPGLALLPYASSRIKQRFQIAPDFYFSIAGGFDLQGGVGIILRPDQPINVVIGLNDPASAQSAQGMLKVRLEYEKIDLEPFVLIGSHDSSRLELKTLSGGGGLSLDARKQAELYVETEMKGGKLVISPGSCDGFLQKILSKDGFGIGVDLMLGFSSRRGFYFRGSGNLEVTLPTHFQLGGIVIQSLTIAANPSEDTLPINLGADIKAQLGPVITTVKNIGLTANFAFPGSGGNLGPIDLNIAFKPPTGAGLTIDSPAVTGGGYLKFDPAEEQYAGILQLEIKGGIAIKAVGLLTTRLPGLPAGQKGFSLLLIITGEFPPVQLGFGFTLKGLGGLVGVNRTMELEVLRAGIKNRTLDSVIFPRNPVDNAQKIISDLQSVFPSEDGRFVFGPMAMLGWGTPPVLHIEIGLVLELPAPLRLAVMGKFSMTLPSLEVPKEAQVAVLRMDALGAIDFEKRDATVDATFFDSHVATFPVTGDMAMRLNWGASPAFILSAGGFNPRFQPPPRFQALDRLAIALATGDNPRIRLEAYLALTPATLQLGARLDLYAKAEVELVVKKETFEATAFLSFDALAHFSPFSFIVDVNGQVAVKGAGQQLGASLSLTLSGPQPWHAHGKVVVDFLGKHTLPVELRIGEERPPVPLPPGNPLEDLRVALKDARNWSAQLPADGHMVVTLRRIPVSETTVLMHPFGELSFRQKVAPLNHRLAKYGNTRPIDPGPFSITSVRLGQITRTAPNTVRDLFAPGQFFEFSDEEKLSRSAFDLLPSGFSGLSATDFKFPTNEKACISTNIEYETVILDHKERASHREQNPYPVAAGLLHIMAGLGAAGQSPMLSTGAARFTGSVADRVQVKSPEYVVAGKEHLQGQSFAPSYTEAAAAKSAMGAAGKNYQIVEKHEIA